MRLLVSADCHLGSPIRSAALRNPELGQRLVQASRDSFARIVTLAMDEAVDALVLAGDIFDNDHPDLKSRAFLITQLARAAEAGIPSVLIRGNHDALLDHRAHGDLGPMIHLLHTGNPSVEIDGVMFHGLSFDSAHSRKSFLPEYPAPVPGRWNIGLMHTSLDGAPGHDPYAPCSEAALMAHGYDLWCLGHIHAPFERRSDDVLAVMPGIPQPRHFGERHGGTVALVTLGAGAPHCERRNVGTLRFAEHTLNLSDCIDQPEVLRRLRRGFLEQQEPGRDTALRLHVLSGHFGAEELQALAAEVLESVEGVHLDKLRVAPPRRQSDAGVDDLVRLMREELRAPGLRLAAQQILEDLRAVLPREVADTLGEDALDDLLDEAVDAVAIAQHSGGSS